MCKWNHCHKRTDCTANQRATGRRRIEPEETHCHRRQYSTRNDPSSTELPSSYCCCCCCCNRCCCCCSMNTTMEKRSQRRHPSLWLMMVESASDRTWIGGDGGDDRCWWPSWKTQSDERLPFSLFTSLTRLWNVISIIINCCKQNKTNKKTK